MSVYRVKVLALALGLAGSVSAAPADIGIILMHGKWGSPDRTINQLAVQLESKGYLVSTPEMTWSGRRLYDRPFEGALAEIDREVQTLRSKGAKKVVIAGQSLGANVALGYAAARPSVDGVIALAPGHYPESPRFRERIAGDIKRAQALIAAGKSADAERFTDINQGKTSPIIVTPGVYLSWFDPEGAAVMPRSAAAIKKPVPLLIVVGSRDRLSRPKEYIFEQAPAHPKSRFATVDADHLEVPSASASVVVSWIESLEN